MIRTFFIIFLFFCMMLIDLEPKATIVNPILNFVNVEWKIPKQFYITKNQTQLLSKSLWYKDDDKNITIPLCVIFDDGLTIYAKTYSGIHVELTKKETTVKHINSDLIKSNGTNNCDKII